MRHLLSPVKISSANVLSSSKYRAYRMFLREWQAGSGACVTHILQLWVIRFVHEFRATPLARGLDNRRGFRKAIWCAWIRSEHLHRHRSFQHVLRLPDASPRVSAAYGGRVSFVKFADRNHEISAYIADAHLGRYKTIHIAIVISIVAHVILVVASVPTVITNRNGSLGAFLVGLITLGVGTGFFKANISPLLAEQNQDKRMRIEVRDGERVIVDPAVTNTRIFLYFYFAINIGAVSGQISMVRATRQPCFVPSTFGVLANTDVSLGLG